MDQVMTHYEYKVVPAPRRGRKGKGIKGAEARFAFAIQTLMNDYAAQGWAFVRAETLPSEERHGLASAHTVYRDVLVFRRDRAVEQAPVNEPALERQDTEAPESAPPETAEEMADPDDDRVSAFEEAEEYDETAAFGTIRRD